MDDTRSKQNPRPLCGHFCLSLVGVFGDHSSVPLPTFTVTPLRSSTPWRWAVRLAAVMSSGSSQRSNHDISLVLCPQHRVKGSHFFATPHPLLLLSLEPGGTPTPLPISSNLRGLDSRTVGLRLPRSLHEFAKTHVSVPRRQHRPQADHVDRPREWGTGTTGQGRPA